MSTFDKIVHTLGVMATGALTTALSMHLTIPIWVAVVTGALSAGSQLTTGAAFWKSPPPAPPS